LHDILLQWQYAIFKTSAWIPWPRLADSNMPFHKVLAFSSILSNSSIVIWGIGYALIKKRFEIMVYGENFLTGADRYELRSGGKEKITL